MVPFVASISAMHEQFDTSNPIIAEILKAKEERLKILQQLNKENEEELGGKDLLTNFKKVKTAKWKRRATSESNLSEVSLRRSTRLQNSPVVKYREIDAYKSEPIRSNFDRPPLDYGEVPGVEVGCHWETRMECSQYGVHRPTVAGIHGGPDGAYSIALSGGYPEDIDEGYTFIYTGAGGRELKGTAAKPKNLRTAPQTKDQQLEGTNLSLVKSIESKLPIRVIRGYKSPSIYAPETGYRYDGLYQVVSFWEDVGQTGYRVYRFKMERIKDQAPPPWEMSYKNFKNKSLRESNEKVLQEFSEESNETEFKENIAPVTDEFVLNDRVTDSLKHFDSEIKKCIDFVSQAATQNGIKIGLDEEEFYGWD